MRIHCLGLTLGLVLCTGCLPQAEEQANVKRVGFVFNDPSGAPLEGIEIEFVACPDVSWTVYLGPSHPTAKPIAASTAACLRALTPGDKVNVRIETKPFGGGVHGGSVTKIGPCVMRPKLGDTFEGTLSTGPGSACKWARD